MRILLVEDSLKLVESLGQALREGGYVVDALCDGGQADRVLLTERYDAIVLDLELPHLDGLTVLRRLRGRGDTTPVLVLTARGGLADRVQGLKVGADDYLPKPFDLSELEARLQALIRRSQAAGAQALTLGTLSYELDSRVFRVGERRLALRPKEHAVLEALLMRAGKAISKEQLFDKVFPSDATTSPDVLDIYIHRLRKQLADSGAAIITLRGLGYMIDAA